MALDGILDHLLQLFEGLTLGEDGVTQSFGFEASFN